jgi:tetratricopeptide (TPR) repeat protein
MIWEPRRHLARLVPVILLGAAAALYASAYQNPFLIDDLDAIESHPDVVQPDGIVTLWAHDYWAGRAPEDTNLYRPVVIASYWLNARLTALNPEGFRIVNLVILAAIGWLLWWWLRGHVGDVLALAAGLLWMAHPLHATVINNLVGRADLLAVGGTLLFLVMQQDALRRGKWSVWFTAAAVAGVIVAVGSKESGLLVVPAAIVQAWCIKTSAAEEARRKALPRRAAWIVGVPTALWFSARAMVVGVGASYGPALADLTGNPLRGLSFLDRLAPACSLALLYLREVVAPSGRSSFIPDTLPTWNDLTPWLGLCVFAAVALGFIAALRRRHLLALPAALALAQFALVGNVLLAIGVYAGARLALPFTLGVVMAAALAVNAFSVNSFSAAASSPRGPWLKRLAVVIFTLLALLSIPAVWAQNAAWGDHMALMRDNLARQPDNARAAFLYGLALGGADRQGEALPHLEKAVARHPRSAQGRRELAKVLIVLGHPDAAAAQYDALLEAHPDDVAARVQRAALALRPQALDLTTAARQLAAAARLAPDDVDVLYHQALLAHFRGHTDDAILLYERLLREHPEDGRARAGYDTLRRQLQPQGQGAR